MKKPPLRLFGRRDKAIASLDGLVERRASRLRRTTEDPHVRKLDGRG